MSRLQQLQRLLQVDPSDTFVLYGIAQEFAKQGDHTQACEYYDRCLAADPNYLYAYYHKAKSQLERDDSTSATTTLATGIEHAKTLRDAKALGELQSLQDSL